MGTTRRWDMTKKEGWRAFVKSKRRERPETLPLGELKKLSVDALEEYNDRRKEYHANFGVLRTPQLELAHEQLDIIFDTGLRVDSDRVKPSAVLDAPAGVGKTTTINEYLRRFERNELTRLGERTDSGHERIPVCRIGMSAQSGLKPVTAAVLRFYGNALADKRSANRAQMHAKVQELMYLSATRFVFVDDIHFVDPGSKDGLAVSNYFKSWSNDLPVCLIMSGVDLEERGIYADGTALDKTHAQNGRRWTPISMEPYTLKRQQGQRDWRSLIANYERILVLAEHEQGSLLEHSTYIYDRTGGYLVGINDLITRAAALAIRRGTERISRDILDAVPMNFTAHQTFWEDRAPSNIVQDAA